MTGSHSTGTPSPSSRPPFPRGVTVIVPTHNRAPSLRRCVEAILACETEGLTVEVRVVDDGSTDETRAVVTGLQAACPPGVSLHYHFQDNQGPAAARNLGGREARGDMILFTDDDCEPAAGWIRGVVSHQWTAEVGGVAGKIESPQAGNWIARYCRHYGYNEFPPRNKPLRRVNFGNTANCAFRREIFLELDGFEEVMSAVGYEDVDFSRRVMVLGYRVEYAPEAVVRHYHREDLRSFYRAFRKRGYAGPLLELLWETPFEITWDGICREAADLLVRIARLPLLPFAAAEHRRAGFSHGEALRFAGLQWLTEVARRCGSLEMSMRILTGRQTLARTSRMPRHHGSLRKALQAARRRQNIDLAECAPEERRLAGSVPSRMSRRKGGH